MITEAPTTDHLRLLIERPTPGAFTLNTSPLGGPAPLADGSGAEWHDVLPVVTGEVVARRGGRAEAGALSVEVGTLTATLLDVPDGYARVGQRIILGRRSGPFTDDVPLFTGRITTVYVVELQDASGAWHTHTSLTAVDAVADLVGVTRYGAVVENGQAAETLDRRVNRLLASVPSWIDYDPVWPWYSPGQEFPAPDAYRVITTSGDLSEADRWTATEGGFVTAGVGGDPRFTLPVGGTASRQITGLVPGRLYGLEVQFADIKPRYGVGDAAPRHTGDMLLFVARAQSETITVAGRLADARLGQIGVASWAHPWFAAASSVHETSLAAYFDATMASYPGAAWWVDPSNRLRFAITDQPGAFVVFTDAETPTEMHYVDLTRAQSTADLATEVVIAAHQLGYDDAGTPTAADRSYALVDDTAAATFGGRSVTRETFTASDLDATALAARLMTDVPGMRVTSIRWNAAEDLPTLDQLDVAGLTRVTRSGVAHHLRIAAITHNITATRHMVTLDLYPKETPA